MIVIRPMLFHSDKKLHRNRIRGNLNIVYLLIIIVLLLPWSAYAGQPDDNVDMLEQTLLQAIDSVCAPLNLDSSGVSLTLGAVRGEKSGFLNRMFRSYLSRKNILVDRPDAAYECFIEQFEADFVYRQKTASLFGLSDTFERQLDIQLVGWIRETDGEMVRFIEIKKSSKDRIREADITALEDGPYRFLQGRIVDNSLWTRAVEPAMVIISVSTVVYLFFIMRS